MAASKLMHTRRFSMMILGIWIGVTAAMVFVAIQNFQGVERLLEAPPPPAGKLLGGMGHENSRMLMRYQASEMNRYFFDLYGNIQIGLALLLTVALLFATNGNKPTLALCLVTVFVVIFEKYWLTPEITYLGRLIDFVPQTAPSAERARFWSFHSTYSTMEIVKLVLVGIIAGKMLVRTDRRSSRRRTRVEEEEVLASAAD